jgi:hypothetical protein
MDKEGGLEDYLPQIHQILYIYTNQLYEPPVCAALSKLNLQNKELTLIGTTLPELLHIMNPHFIESEDPLVSAQAHVHKYDLIVVGATQENWERVLHPYLLSTETYCF